MRVTSLLVCVLAWAAGSGCGSDPEREFFPQALFRVEARGGGACFRLDHIASSGARHEVDADRTFALVTGERYTFLLVNAPPPYEARFDWVEADCPDTTGTIEVTGFEVQGPSAEPRVLDADHPTATLSIQVGADAPLATTLERPRVRFEVCSPIDGVFACGGGPTGRAFTGNVGDAQTSHLLSLLESDDAATTQAIILLERPRDRVGAIFRGLIDQVLRAELYINDIFENADNSDRDVVLAEDL